MAKPVEWSGQGGESGPAECNLVVDPRSGVPGAVRLKQELLACMESPARKVSLCFSEGEHFHGSLLQVMIAAEQELPRHGKTLWLGGVTEGMRKWFALTGTETWLLENNT